MFSIQMLLHFSQIVPRVCTLVLSFSCCPWQLLDVDYCPFLSAAQNVEREGGREGGREGERVRRGEEREKGRKR